MDATVVPDELRVATRCGRARRHPRGHRVAPLSTATLVGSQNGQQWCDVLGWSARNVDWIVITLPSNRFRHCFYLSLMTRNRLDLTGCDRKPREPISLVLNTIR